jgi:hypothetical protein
MFFDEIHEGINIFGFCEDGPGKDIVPAAFAVIDTGIFFHQLSAVDFSVGYQKYRGGRFMDQEEEFFD